MVLTAVYLKSSVGGEARSGARFTTIGTDPHSYSSMASAHTELSRDRICMVTRMRENCCEGWIAYILQIYQGSEAEAATGTLVAWCNHTI